jgi:hypothetical protein
MSHVAKSKLIEEIIIELRRKGLEIPANIMSDLKAARTLLVVEKVDLKGKGATDPQIDQYLNNVESYVVTEAEKRFPPEKVKKWLTELDLASCESCVTIVAPKEEMRMIPGIPRDQKWIRVEPIATLSSEKLEKMAEATNLSVRKEKDGHLVVYGADKDVKEFVKKMTTKQTEKKTP